MFSGSMQSTPVQIVLGCFGSQVLDSGGLVLIHLVLHE